MSSATATQSVPESRAFGRERLGPGAYRFNWEATAAIPLLENGQPSTFGDVLRKLANAKVNKIEDRGHIIFHTEEGHLSVGVGELPPEYKGVNRYIVLSIVRELAELMKDGINLYRATWYYFANDWSRDADELHVFFIVHDGKIVREWFSVMNCAPRILAKSVPDGEPIWNSEPNVEAAREIYWYREFYTQTEIGKLQVLRPDEPVLYHFDRQAAPGSGAHDSLRALGVVTVVKSYRLLWIIAALLAAIAFPPLSTYMGIVAIGFTVDLLWRAWRTRKVGIE